MVVVVVVIAVVVAAANVVGSEMRTIGAFGTGPFSVHIRRERRPTRRRWRRGSFAAIAIGERAKRLTEKVTVVVEQPRPLI